MTEAAAAGLKLIAPDHTAYRAYLDAGIATMLPCAAVRAAIEGRDEPAASARERMLNYPRQAAARRLCEIVDEAVAARRAAAR